MTRPPSLRHRQALGAAALVALGSFAGLRGLQARPADQPDAPSEARRVQQVSLIPSACRVAVTEGVLPLAPRICDEARVDVTMAVTCPTNLPIHLVIAVDRSKSIADPPTNPLLRDIQQSARKALDAIDFDANPENKVAVLSHGFRVTVETELTGDPGRANGAIGSVRYQPSDLGEDPAAAVNKAMQLLKEARSPSLSPLEVILLYGDGCDPSEAGCMAASKAAASRAAGEGVAVMTVCYKESPRQTCAGSYKPMASEPGYYFESRSAGVPRAIEQLLEKGESLGLESLLLTEMLGPDVRYLGGVAGAPPAPTALPPRLGFTFADVAPGRVVTASYRAQPAREGQVALRTGDSSLSFVDSLERTLQGIIVPPRELAVGPCIQHTATPEPSPSPEPSLTPSPEPTIAATATATDRPMPSATDTPAPTATDHTRYAYLPLLMRQVCRPRAASRNFVVLVIDASSSMEELSGSQTKIAAAKAAALAFVELFDSRLDRVGLVTFHSGAPGWEEGSIWPTDDFGRLSAAIGGIQTQPGTRIDLALERVQAVLREMTPTDLRAEYDNVFSVLMTDGRPTEGTTADILARAATIKEAGMRIYTVGLGADIDRALLRQISSGPGYDLEAPSADQLAGLYRSLAVNADCPGGVPWERP